MSSTADIIAPELNPVRVSNLEYNPASNTHVLRPLEQVELSSEESLAALRRANALNASYAHEEGRDEELLYRQLSPTEKLIHLEKKYTPIILNAYSDVETAKAELDNYQSSELQFIANHVAKTVYYDRSAEGYKCVTCYGIHHYKETILKDDDLMQNYYEVDRKQVGVAPGSGTQWIYYLPRGVKPSDLEAKAREEGAKLYIDERPKYERQYEAAFVKAESLVKEYQRVKAEIRTMDDITALMGKFERPASRKRSK